jgi:hypothetical protein
MSKSKSKSKSISVVEMVENFQKSEEGQECIAILNAKRKAHPAKFARQYDLEIMSLCMEMAGRVNILTYLQNLLTTVADCNVNELTKEQTENIWERRTTEIYALHAAQVKYDIRKAELDKAVLEYDTGRA